MKRIIVLCDGTGQSASRGDESVSTNVNRIGHALSHKGPVQQLIYYQSGIGTEDLDKWSKITAGGLGYGLEDNVLDAYTFVMNNYEPNDEIFVFGFSRGAFTARVLANFMARIGIFRKPEYAWELKQAWKAYRGGHDSFEAHIQKVASRSVQYDGNNPRQVKANIKVVGCWDTVASVGVPEYARGLPLTKDYSYLDGSLVPGIEHAFHALALDEYRYPFTPTMWFLPADEAAAQGIELRQAWFPGVHTNVGGGYADQALGDLTLAWMIDCCRPYLDFHQPYMDLVVKLDHHPGSIISAHRTKNHDLDTSYQGWGLGRQYDSYKQGQTFTWKYRTPNQYAKDEKKPVGPTNERIHASVRERWNLCKQDKKDYRPASLSGFKPEERDGQWLWVKRDRWGKELVSIEEEPFATKPEERPFEWLLRYDTK